MLIQIKLKKKNKSNIQISMKNLKMKKMIKKTIF